MRIIKVNLPTKHEIIFEGDEHKGNLLFSDSALDQCMDYVMTKKNRYIIKMGDMIEAIAPDDKRYEAKTHMDSILKQYVDVLEYNRPFRKRILCWLFGNHEYKVFNRFGNATEMWCNELKVNYGTFTSLICVHDLNDKLLYKIHATHGHCGISSAADNPIRVLSNLKISLQRALKNKFSDVLIHAKGHTHKLLLAEPLKTLTIHEQEGKLISSYDYTYGSDHGIIHPDHRYYVNTGSFLKLYGDGYSGYAEMSEYDPVDLGYAVFRMDGKEVEEAKLVVV